MDKDTIKKKLLEYCKTEYDIPLEERRVFAIRGLSNDLTWNDDKIDVFNDLFIVLDKDNIDLYRGTIDPGLYWILKPMAGLIGTARLLQGLYIYQKVIHRKIKAFGQKSMVSVRRDVNRNSIWEFIEPKFTGYFAINIHPKLGNTKNVRSNSAGCGVLDSMENEKPWQDFRRSLAHLKDFKFIVLDQEFAKNLLK